MDARKPLVPQRRRFQRLWLIALSLLALLCLSGCVRYEVGVTMTGQYSGAITQHIRLGEPLTNFSQQEVLNWLDTLEQRARKLHGQAQRVNAAELMVTIPFSNGAQLQERFNQFFNPTGTTQPPQPAQESALVELTAGLGLQQTNLLLFERDRVILDVDLRGLGSLGSDRDVVLDANSVLDLSFALDTPWGARSLSDNTVPYHRSGSRLVWQLQPGEINHLSASFWLPSALGFGAIAILALVIGGTRLKGT
jgi:hypothetical protein